MQMGESNTLPRWFGVGFQYIYYQLKSCLFIQWVISIIRCIVWIMCFLLKNIVKNIEVNGFSFNGYKH